MFSRLSTDMPNCKVIMKVLNSISNSSLSIKQLRNSCSITNSISRSRK